MFDEAAIRSDMECAAAAAAPQPPHVESTVEGQVETQHVRWPSQPLPDSEKTGEYIERLCAEHEAEAEQLRERLQFTCKNGGFTTITATGERCDHCPGKRGKLDWRANEEAQKAWESDLSWHKPDCKWAAAQAAAKGNADAAGS